MNIRALSDTAPLDSLEPLSLVLFRGDGFVSEIIMDAESFYTDKELYSHCGILVNTQVLEIKNGIEGEWYVYELTCSGKIANDPTPNIETGSPRFGTQIRPLKSLLTSYPGSIAVLSLKSNPTSRAISEEDEEYRKRLLSLRFKASRFKALHDGTHYQLNLLRLLSSLVPCIRNLRLLMPFSQYWMMCSQFCASFYQSLSIIDPSINAENVVPVDFIYDSDRDLKEGIFMLPPYELAKSRFHMVT